jgi:hypothetical protein
MTMLIDTLNPNASWICLEQETNYGRNVIISGDK